MKTIMLALCLLATSALSSIAQTTYEKNDQGELVQVATIHTEAEVIGTMQLSGETFKATNGISYPVYITSKGSKCYVKKAKSGNHYKVYLKEK